MASMAFIDEHNEIAKLKKPKQAAGFHQIVDFLKTSHIAHALTVSPSIYIEHERQFWANATIVAENGVQMIKTRVCEKPLTVTEEVIRISLRLDDATGISSISNDELFSTLTRMGYGGPLGVFKFSKAKFSPQWRFFVHTLMHCISKKTTGWSEFSSTIAYALVCLATARKYNFSKMIFNYLVSNLGSKKSFYMYPWFVQEVITHELTDMPHFDGVYVPKIPKGKVFSNMKRSPLDSEGVDTPLFSTMMVVSHTDEGMAAGSRPLLDHPTASQSQPSHSKSIPQSLLDKPTSPIIQTYKRKQVKKAPSLLVPSPIEPLSPLMENSPLENIHRETTGVSPNPKEVLTEERVEYMGTEAATTSASTEKDSGNINKTSPMANLNAQSFKGPRCQETTGVESASARQKASTTKRSHDPSKGGNTPEEGEDRYDYLELMDTMANINRDVINQGKDIEELKLIVLSHQAQISKLQNMKAAVTEQATETINAASSSKATKMVSTAEISKAAETVKEVLTELEIAETLKTNVEEKVISKEKGKAKLVESDQPKKKQKLIEADEALARKIQAELEEAEIVQVANDREIAKAMFAELNKAYQQSLATEQAKHKATFVKKPTKIKMAARKRQPSKTYLGAQERKKMITFLKGAVGVKVEMFSKMSFDKLKKMYDAEMTKLQGDDIARVEMEKRMKESNDFLQKPFPDEQETPEKEATIGESLRTLKRTKMIARRKPTKKPRLMEEEAEKVVEEEEAPFHLQYKNLQVLRMLQWVKPPEVIHWDVLVVDGKEYIRLKRNDEKYEVYNTWNKIVRTCSRFDIEEMFEMGMKLYADELKAPVISITKLIMEYLYMMFKPDEVEEIIRNVFKSVNSWTLYETSGVYAVTLDLNHTEYFLVDRVYNHSRLKLHAMLKKKLGFEFNAAGTKLMLLFKISTAAVTTAKRLVLLSMVSTAELSTAKSINAAYD
ncbi:hypothetical protein L6452_01974 [Arctium lappa]|uniref:Uncharacterized protein n=1 Tax=Arctium lappa TaxID=4217 RepID=A0ACB9FHK9_ARCLA|nr:hypothetical protein L6452_01974 [Arctium lappa]